MRKFTIFLFIILMLPVTVQARGPKFFEPPGQAKREEVRQEESVKPKIRFCRFRERNIQNKVTSLTKLAENQTSKFDRIAQRVKTHYQTKLVPEGKAISNYDFLNSEINRSKALVDQRVVEAKNLANDFNCDETNPQAGLKKYLEQMRLVKQALHNYRIAIKNLIVAINGNQS